MVCVLVGMGSGIDVVVIFVGVDDDMGNFVWCDFKYGGIFCG